MDMAAPSELAGDGPIEEFGDIDAAVRELRIAQRLARRTGSTGREADVLGTQGVALIAGRTVSGRNALNAAFRQYAGRLQSRMLFRAGNLAEALHPFLPHCRRHVSVVDKGSLCQVKVR